MLRSLQFHPVHASRSVASQRNDEDQRSPYLLLIRMVRRRWMWIRVAEIASYGWALGLVLTATAIALGGGVLAWLPPLVAAGIAVVIAVALSRVRISPSDAADRLDKAFATKELFGTALRMTGDAAGDWLAARADDQAQRLTSTQPPLARLGRRWWGGLAAGTTLMATAGLILPSTSDTTVAAASRSATRYTARNALIADVPPSASSDARPPASANDLGSRLTSRTAAMPTAATDGGDAVHSERAAAAIDSLDDNHSAPGVSASGAGGTSQTPPMKAPERASIGQRPLPAARNPVGHASASGQAGGGGKVHQGNTPESAVNVSDSRPRDVEPAAPPSSRAPVNANASITARDRTVPARYRSLVRRYFSGDDSAR